MKIIVFGATGRTGQQVVRQALNNGLEVTAFVRNPAKLDVRHEMLRVVQGDAMSREQVSAAIAGHDAVVSCLGSARGLKRSTELQEMARNIVDGMREHGVKRIVYTASAGIDREIPGLSGKLIMYLLRHVLADHRAAVDHIRTQPGLLYTIVRPLGLTDRPFTGEYREAERGVPPKAMSIPRADVAHFILKALNDSRYSNTSVGIAT
jgi:putative NADH-flavin reductase